MRGLWRAFMVLPICYEGYRRKFVRGHYMRPLLYKVWHLFELNKNYSRNYLTFTGI